MNEKPDNKSKESRIIDIALAVIGTAMVLYHLISSQYILTEVVRHTNIHLGFAFVMIFLSTMKGRGKFQQYLRLALIILALISIAYVFFLSKELQMREVF